MSATQVSGDNLAGFNKAGIIGGAFITRPFTKTLSGQMEMIYIQKGSKKNPNPDNGDYTLYKMQLHYAEVPLMLEYHKGKFKYEAGISVSALLDYNVENESGNFPTTHTEMRPFNKAEFSGNFGISYALGPKWEMNWRYSNSLLPIRNHLSNKTYRLNRGQYNSALEFTLNYIFFKKES